MEPALANPAYYLDDFEHVLASVERLYAGLLDAREQGFITRLRRLSRPARMVYARLCNRKGPYFRPDRLNYPEIGPLEAAIGELGRHGLLEPCHVLPEDPWRLRLLACFTLAELREALRPHAPRKGGRQGMLEWLSGWQDARAWSERLLRAHPVIALPQAGPWPFLRFLFFGELRDNLSDFVTRALGHIVTESCDPAQLRPCFQSRAEAEDAYRLAVLYRSFREIRETQPALASLAWWQEQRIERPKLAAGHAWFDRLVDRLGRRLEREGEPEAALQLYAASPVAPARERQARLLIKAGRRGEASALLQEMAASPCHPEEAYIARQLLARLNRAARRSEARQLEAASRVIALPYSPRSGVAGTGDHVEAAVLAHYRAQGWQGVHAENWLWNASFGLLLWDIIYDPACGAFHSPLQFGPSDLYSPQFYGRRAGAIETRLAVLRDPAAACTIVQRHIAAKQGIANPFVAWHADLPEILSVLLHRVPASGHAAVLRHMARNPRHHMHGFLDLFIWNEDDYRFIEIKGEGDQLAAHQFEWLRFFAEAGLNVALEKVVRTAPGFSNGA